MQKDKENQSLNETIAGSLDDNLAVIAEQAKIHPSAEKAFPMDSSLAERMTALRQGALKANLPSTFFRRQDLNIDDNGAVIIRPGTHPSNPNDENEDEVEVVELSPGQFSLAGISLDRHLAAVRFQERVKNQLPGWYHWDQIEELTLTRSYEELHFRVVVGHGEKPHDAPSGLVNYFLNVSDKGTAVYHPDATDAEHRRIKEEFDEFKLFSLSLPKAPVGLRYPAPVKNEGTFKVPFEIAVRGFRPHLVKIFYEKGKSGEEISALLNRVEQKQATEEETNLILNMLKALTSE